MCMYIILKNLIGSVMEIFWDLFEAKYLFEVIQLVETSTVGFGQL